MKNLKQLYNEIIKEKEPRGFKALKWQEEYLTEEESYTAPIFVLGAGTSSGKTISQVMGLDIFYKQPENNNKRTLVLAASMKDLAKNFADNIEDYGDTSFTWKVAKGGKELQQAIKDGYQVIITLPQSAGNVLDSLTVFDRFILDEAHEWYFANTVQAILKKMKPSQQTLLTGTPFEFTLKKEELGAVIKYVPVMDLDKEGLISDFGIEIISSAYSFKEDDYNLDGVVTEEAFTEHLHESRKAFRKVCVNMINRLSNPVKDYKNVNRLTNDLGGKLFKQLGKTVIFTRRKEQANMFFRELNKFKGLKGRVLLSHSDNDPDSENLQRLKEEDDILVVVVVNRARLGWSYTELFNVVDFTMTRTPSTLLQMLARIFRKSKVSPNKRKMFYKVANSTDAPYFVIIMQMVLLLLYREWYTKFNGKNLNQIPLPRVVRPRIIEPTDEPTERRRRNRQEPYTLFDMGVPLGKYFFRDNVWNKKSDYFGCLAHTTMTTIRAEFLNIVSRYTLDYAKSTASKYKTRHEFLVSEGINLPTWIRNNGHEDECYGHMQDWVIECNRNNPEFILDYFERHKNKIKTQADIYNIRSEVYSHIEDNEKYSGNWFKVRAKELKIWDEVKQILGLRAKSTSWTKNEVLKIAKKYKNVTQMEAAGYYGATAHAKREGYYDELKQMWGSQVKIAKELTTGVTGTYKELADHFTKVTGVEISKGVINMKSKQGHLIVHKNSPLKGYQFQTIN